MDKTTAMITDDIKQFISEWTDTATDSVLVHTSGSTGAPKPFWASKQKMANSAIMTCDFLGLQAGDTALLCMPMKYIAGKMVVVRSIVRKLELIAVEPSGHPLKDIDRHIRFAAMTPMQVYNTLQVPEEAQRLRNIDNLIIGGGAVDSTLQSLLSDMPTHIYSTYGMTETLSHIAMRRLNGPDASDWYTPLNNVSVSTNADNVLVIDAPLVSTQQLVTNDIAEVNSHGQFRIIGRRDNTINSGGIKIQIEEAERLLRPHINGAFAITSAPDTKFGEIVVIVVEQGTHDDTLKACQEALPHMWIPKRIINGAIPLTETNKPDRFRLKQIAASATQN